MYRAIAFSLLVTASASAEAATQQYDFSGSAVFGEFGVPGLPSSAKAFTGTITYDSAAAVTQSFPDSHFYEPEFSLKIVFEDGKIGLFDSGFGNISVERHPGQLPSLRFTRGGIFAGDASANLTLDFTGTVDSWGDLALPSSLSPLPQPNFISITYGGLSIETRRKEALGRLNNLSPTAVPESATWAMMISGFALIGATLRRRMTPIAVPA